MGDTLRIQGINDFGYGMVGKRAMIDPNLTIEAKGIYAYLCSYTGEGKTAFPGADLIRHQLQIGKDRYYKHRKLLVDNGYLEVEQNIVNGEFKNNIFTLKMIIEKQKQNQDTVNTDTRDTDSNSNNNNNNNLNNKKIYSATASEVETTEKKPKKKKPNYKGFENEVIEIIDYMNLRFGTSYRTTTQEIINYITKWLLQDYTVEQCKSVIDKKNNEWANSDMAKYLRPSTLFSGKFTEYVQQKNTTATTAKPKGINNFEQKEMDLNTIMRLEKERLKKSITKEPQ